MSVLIILTILSIWHGNSRALLDQGIPSTPKLPADEAAYLHQIINQESALRMELEKQITSLQSSVYTFQKEFLAMKNENNIMKGNLSSVQHDVSRLKLENSALLRNISTINHSAGLNLYDCFPLIIFSPFYFTITCLRLQFRHKRYKKQSLRIAVLHLKVIKTLSHHCKFLTTTIYKAVG